MASYSPGELVLISFPFASLEGAKRRPALTLLDVGDLDIVVARVTTHLTRTEFDVHIQDWQAAGLLAPSVVRIHKLATLEKRLVVRKLGTLSGKDWQLVRERIQELWSAI